MSLIKGTKNLLLIVLLVLFALLSINCSAPDTTGPDTGSPATTPASIVPAGATSPDATSVAITTPIETEEKSFIWQITSGTSTLYLLGSIHVADADTFPLATVIEDAFAEADILAVEVDISEVDETASLALILEYGTYPSGETLEDNMPQELYESLADKFAGWGISIGFFKGYRPWVVENLLEVTTLQMLDYTSEYGIDLYFLEKAASRDMEIVELESEEFQIQLLADIPDDIMIKIIEMNLDEPVTIEDIEEMFTYWETGDVAALEDLIFEGLDEEPQLLPYYQAMFTDRNHTMMDKIVGFLEDDETYFVVVGAGHLVGEEGLLNLLENAGYSVEQLQG
jgi:uncharacterized protein YbaP (TraB family)